MSRRRRARASSTSIAMHTPVVHRHGQRLRAAHPAEAGRQRHASRAATRRSAGGRARRTSRTCPGGSPGCRCRSTTRPSSGRTSSGPAARARGTDSQFAHLPTRFEFAMSTRGAHSWVRNDRRPACPTGRAASRRRRGAAARGRWRRTPPSCAPRGRCRRRRRAASGSSATSGSRLFMSIRRTASCCQPRVEARCRAGRGRVGDRGRSGHGRESTPRSRPQAAHELLAEVRGRRARRPRR